MAVVDENRPDAGVPRYRFDQSVGLSYPDPLPDENARLALAEFSHSSPIANSTPPEIRLDLSSACRLRCVHCSRSYSRRRWLGLHRKPPHLPRKAMLWIPDRFYRSARQIELSGMGEPMLHPEWEDILEWVAGKSRGHITFNTSLAMATEPRLRRLAELGAGVSVSIDAARKETYERIRRGASHAVVFGWLARLSQLGQQFANPRFFLRIKWTLMRPNLRELSEFVDIAAGMGIKEIQAQPLAPHHPSLIDWCCTTNDPETEEFLLRAFERATTQRVALTVPLHLLFTPALRSALSQNARGTHLQAEALWHHHWPDSNGCSYPWTQLSVDSSANVLACCFSNAHMGNLLREDLGHIWNNAYMARFRGEVNENRCSTFCVDSPSGGVCCPRIQWLRHQQGQTHFLQEAPSKAGTEPSRTRTDDDGARDPMGKSESAP